MKYKAINFTNILETITDTLLDIYKLQLINII